MIKKDLNNEDIENNLEETWTQPLKSPFCPQDPNSLHIKIINYEAKASKPLVKLELKDFK